MGEQLTVEELLYCIMVVSGNDAANVLAETVSGSVAAFVDAMNAKADALGCENTHFVNPHGLHDEDHYTTARDLYVITKGGHGIRGLHDHRRHPAALPCPPRPSTASGTLYTTNYLLSPYRAAGYVYPGAAGVKTGTTTPAGNCLISTATKNDRSLLGIILGAERVEREDGSVLVTSFSQMADLFDWGFDDFSRQTILSSTELVDELAVSLSETTHIVVQPAYDVERLLPDDVAVEDLERTLSYPDYPEGVVEAPISAGAVLGEITVSLGDTVYATVPPGGAKRRGPPPACWSSAHGAGVCGPQGGTDRRCGAGGAGDRAADPGEDLRPPPQALRPGAAATVPGITVAGGDNPLL